MTTRGSPDATAASMSAKMASRSTSGDGNEAAWINTSCPSAARRSDAGWARSPGRACAFSAASVFCAAGERVSPVTLWPWPTSARTTAPPTYPEPPVTRTRMALQDALQRDAHLGRRARDLDARRLERGDLLRRRALAAGDDGAGVAHALARRGPLAGNERGH